MGFLRVVTHPSIFARPHVSVGVALMRQHGVPTIWSHDQDFRKFAGIAVRDPFGQRYATGFE